jgi:hypothetical protein
MIQINCYFYFILFLLSGKRNYSIALNEIILPNLAFLCEMPHNWTFFENYSKKYFIAYQETLLEHFVMLFFIDLIHGWPTKLHLYIKGGNLFCLFYWDSLNGGPLPLICSIGKTFIVSRGALLVLLESAQWVGSYGGNFEIWRTIWKVKLVG